MPVTFHNLLHRIYMTHWFAYDRLFSERLLREQDPCTMHNCWRICQTRRSWERGICYQYKLAKSIWVFSILKPTWCTIFRVYWIWLCMFRTVFPSIIRSSRLYTQHQVYVIQVMWLFASMRPTNLYGMMPYVKSWTPDDGRKDRPKHAEWYSINWKYCASSWF